MERRDGSEEKKKETPPERAFASQPPSLPSLLTLISANLSPLRPATSPLAGLRRQLELRSLLHVFLSSVFVLSLSYFILILTSFARKCGSVD